MDIKIKTYTLFNAMNDIVLQVKTSNEEKAVVEIQHRLIEEYNLRLIMTLQELGNDDENIGDVKDDMRLILSEENNNITSLKKIASNINWDLTITTENLKKL